MAGMKKYREASKMEVQGVWQPGNRLLSLFMRENRKGVLGVFSIRRKTQCGIGICEDFRGGQMTRRLSGGKWLAGKLVSGTSGRVCTTGRL